MKGKGPKTEPGGTSVKISLLVDTEPLDCASKNSITKKWKSLP